MTKFKRILCLFTVFFLLAAGSAFSQNIINNITDVVNDFSGALVNSLPFNSTIGLNWSDAHIGKFFPSAPPHFGIGLTIGVTSIPIGSINELAEVFGVNLPADVDLGFPMPAYTLDARIGGFFLPFDIGIKFGYLPQIELLTEMTGFGMNYMLMGADIRYQLLDLKFLKFSVGLGYNRLEGGVSQGIGDSITINYGPYSLSATQPELGLRWETDVIEFKAQLSFPIVVVTPYVGIGASYAWSKAGYGLTSTITATANGVYVPDIEQIVDELNNLGLSGITSNGFEQMVEAEGFNFRLFGGLSVNLPFVRFDLTAMYNLMDTIYTENFNLSSLGITFGVRLQL